MKSIMVIALCLGIVRFDSDTWAVVTCAFELCVSGCPVLRPPHPKQEPGATSAFEPPQATLCFALLLLSAEGYGGTPGCNISDLEKQLLLERNIN